MDPLYQAFVSHLKAHAPLTALVGTKIYALDAPSGTAKPYITFFRYSGRPFTTLQTGGTLFVARIQVDCVSETPDDAVSIARTVYSRVHGFKGQMGTNALEVRHAVFDTQADQSLASQNAHDISDKIASIDFNITYFEPIS